MQYDLLLPPVVGGVIGWITNYVAIKLLFRPHVPFRFLGIQVQGVIPKRRKEIARSMAKTIEKELLSSHDLAKALSGLEWEKEIEQTVEEAVEHRFSSKYLKLPLVGLVSDNLKGQIKLILTKEIISHLDRKKDKLAAKVKDSIDVQELLVNRIDKLDLKNFERLLTDFIARELKHLEYLGGVMGFLIGVFQSVFMLVSGW
ncbi:MAG: hypothetical protein A2052_08470 [Deltaproteobacteria bacterium GWA2_54_12]|nr:MAG: hypothetical protein A2052_08470 [Deltaproteobacteria bacterium GWA2_54_12]